MLARQTKQRAIDLASPSDGAITPPLEGDSQKPSQSPELDEGPAKAAAEGGFQCVTLCNVPA